MKKETSFLTVVLSTFKTFSCFLILVVLPMSFLYYIDSYLLISTKQHLLDTAIIILFFLCFACLVSLLAGILYIIFSLFLKKETAARVSMVFGLLGFALAVYEFIKTTRLWLVKTFPDRGWNLEIVDISVIILAITSLVLIFIFRTKAVPRLKEEREKGFKAVIFLASVSMIFVAGQVLHAYWCQNPENTAHHADRSVAANQWPNLIFITFDALTAEDMSLYGYHLQTSPHLDAFAGESYLFKNMYANANWTRPSVASLLTGTYPWTHRLIHLGKYNCFLPENLSGKNIAALLKREGYQTAAIVSNLGYAHPSTNDTLQSFDCKPFDTVQPDFKPFATETFFSDESVLWFLKIRSTAHIWLENIKSTYARLFMLISFPGDVSKWNHEPGAPAALTFDLASRYLQEVDRPFFLWIHVMPPHAPYLPGNRFRKRFLTEDAFLTVTDQMIPGVSERFIYPENVQPLISKLRLRYNEFILDTDNEFGLFLSRIKAQGLLDTSIVIVSSDHGESFERGYVTHGGPMLYNNLVHIPLLIHTPGQKNPFVINRPAEQVDLAPTILDFLGLPIPPWMEGESLKPFLEKGAATGKPKFSMQLDENSVTGNIKKGVIAVILDNYKYIYNLNTQKSELYHLTTDPGESTNLAGQDPQRSAVMRQLILDKLAKVNQP